jgi:tyrosinase
MTFTRRNVWELGETWADPILWYARGVEAMQAKALAEPTSWRFFAAIHGFSVARWQRLGALTETDEEPTRALIRQFWVQCQHGSWFFLPWHRGYLLGFEATVRSEVLRLGGPEDWALPYWNYFRDGQGTLPPAFATPDWPDGDGSNPLFLAARYGPANDGDVFVPVTEVNLDAMAEPDFTGVSSGGSPGFGGVDTGFSHGGGVHGALETQPHDWVHGLVGGADPVDPTLAGAMSDPRTAALDPIFWLHHANIDRLWESWTRLDDDNFNPVAPRWLDGPASLGQRVFAVPMPDRDKDQWIYTPTDVTDLAALGYQYDDLTPGQPTPPEKEPRHRRGRARRRRRRDSVVRGFSAMADESHVELFGASPTAVTVRGSEASSSVRLDNDVRRRAVVRKAAMAAEGEPEPDRVFLNLENVRGPSDATAFHVYVAVPAAADPADRQGELAGSIAPFGMAQASDPEEGQGGEGLTFVLEITDLVDRIRLDESFDVDDLEVRIVPVTPVPDAVEFTIGRISLFRQGA